MEAQLDHNQSLDKNTLKLTTEYCWLIHLVNLLLTRFIARRLQLPEQDPTLGSEPERFQLICDNTELLSGF